MDFKQAEEKFKQLKAQYISGTLSETEFKSQLEALMFQDENGNWWMIGYETELWYQHDGTDWVQIDLPYYHSKKLTFSLPRSFQPAAIKSKIIAFLENISRLRDVISRPIIILIIAILTFGLTLIGGYSIGKNFSQEQISSATKSPVQAFTGTSTTTFTSTVTFTKRPSQTPRTSSTPMVESIVFVNTNRAQMYQGPGLAYYIVDQASYQKDEKLTVLAKDTSGLWFLCEAMDGTVGWLYLDWIRFSSDTEIIPTASFIPHAPPTPTRKQKGKEPEPTSDVWTGGW